ncbi:MAG: thioredoxin family protein [Rhodopseudomonas palustris]|nr:thioredoxin family protein [Rhodopseudomonas palustris]
MLFIVAALLFAKPVLKQGWPVFLAVGSIPLLIAIFRESWVRKTTGYVLAAMMLAALLFIHARTRVVIPDYITIEKTAVSEAVSSKKLVLLDFYADWCAACKELDEKTWEDPKVKKVLASRFVFTKVDFTTTCPGGDDFRKKYAVVGLPTVIVLDGSGVEKARFSGFRTAEDFLSFAGNIQ